MKEYSEESNRSSSTETFDKVVKEKSSYIVVKKEIKEIIKLTVFE